jgi:hypothetical protein
VFFVPYCSLHTQTKREWKVQTLTVAYGIIKIGERYSEKDARGFIAKLLSKPKQGNANQNCGGNNDPSLKQHCEKLKHFGNDRFL